MIDQDAGLPVVQATDTAEKAKRPLTTEQAQKLASLIRQAADKFPTYSAYGGGVRTALSELFTLKSEDIYVSVVRYYDNDIARVDIQKYSIEGQAILSATIKELNTLTKIREADVELARDNERAIAGNAALVEFVESFLAGDKHEPTPEPVKKGFFARWFPTGDDPLGP